MFNKYEKIEILKKENEALKKENYRLKQFFKNMNDEILRLEYQDNQKTTTIAELESK